MSKWKLLTPIILIVVSSLSAYLSYRLNEEVVVYQEIFRQLKVGLQRYQQTRTRLLTLKNSEKAVSRIQSIDTLKVSLIEKMLQSSWPKGVSNVSYEFHELPRRIMIESNYPVNTVRVLVNFEAQHAISLINYLDSLILSVHPQAIEVRGCDSYKQAQKGLKVNCALDLHHWRESNVL